MKQGNTILVVDDDQKCRNILSNYLKEQGCRVDAVADEEGMNRLFSSLHPDLIVLDLALSGSIDLSITRNLRSRSDIPLIIVSPRGDDVDRIVGLEMGADDYMVKPVNPRELLARIRAILGRSATRKQSAGSQDDGVIQFGKFLLNPSTHTLKRGEEKIELSTAQFRLLQHLAERPHRVISREQLSELMGFEAKDGIDRRIDVLVARLRKVIEEDPHHPRLIRTVRGQGYLFA